VRDHCVTQRNTTDIRQDLSTTPAEDSKRLFTRASTRSAAICCATTPTPAPVGTPQSAVTSTHSPRSTCSPLKMSSATRRSSKLLSVLVTFSTPTCRPASAAVVWTGSRLCSKPRPIRRSTLMVFASIVWIARSRRASMMSTGNTTPASMVAGIAAAASRITSRRGMSLDLVVRTSARRSCEARTDIVRSRRRIEREHVRGQVLPLMNDGFQCQVSCTPHSRWSYSRQVWHASQMRLNVVTL
jgi:hypothetical protein